MINLAFNVIDSNGDGIVDVQEVVKKYNADQHPKVKSGDMTRKEVLMEFMETFEVGETVDGMVTRQEFTNYYHNLSSSIDSDDYWELMMRNAWHIAGGEGWCANSSNLRVLATMDDGSQSVQTVNDDLGSDKTDQQDIIRRLKRQGVSGVKGFSTAGSCDDEGNVKKGKMVPLSELAAMAKANPRGEQEEKKADLLTPKGNPKPKIPQSLANRLEGKSIADEMGAQSTLISVADTKNSSSPNKRQTLGVIVGGGASTSLKSERSNVPSAGLQMIVNKVKSQLKKHGASGFVGLQRKFRIMDDNGDKTLDLGEFGKGMKELKMGLNDSEVRMLFTHFDGDGGGSISFDEFINGVRDPLNKKRLALVHLAFDVIDKDQSGVVEPKEMMSCYDASKHPEVIAGKKTADAVLREFLSTFDVGGVVDGMVTREEFENYYTNIGANIDRDDYFELMIRLVDKFTFLKCYVRY